MEKERQEKMKTKTLLKPANRRDKKKMLSAVKKQEDIKKKYGAPEKGWSSLSALRKWKTSH